MKKLKPWVRLPSRWIEEHGLHEFRWVRGKGADNVAALMALTAISHQVDDESGVARLTYDSLSEITSLSRAKLSAGLGVLVDRGQLERGTEGRSSFRLVGYDPKFGWAQFPAAGLYRDGAIDAFKHLHLRQPAELDALKLYFLFASRRDRKTNLAMITYEKIEDYSGVGHNSIRRALSWLAVQGLIHVERVPSVISVDGVANAYRLAHLDTRRHMGTLGRIQE
jgi:DNA-binding transcriptional ArsR family regulator